jgi:hypothetical protein
MQLRWGVLAAAVLLAGCSISRNQFVPAPSGAAAPGVSLKDKSVYIYCFLDVRADSIGRPMLAQFDAMLEQSLKDAGIRISSLHFTGAGTGVRYDSALVSVAVPVAETIAANKASEQGAGTQYRLVLFPSESYAQTIDAANSARAYNIRWDLYETGTGTLVWSTQSVGSQASIFFGSEKRPEERARKTIDGLMAELRKSGLL